jgi:hypothetical protein
MGEFFIANLFASLFWFGISVFQEARIGFLAFCFVLAVGEHHNYTRRISDVA